MFRFAKPLAAAAIALTAVGAQAQSLDTVVAKVNGTDITLGEMLVTRMQLPPQYQQLPDEALFDGILTQIIQQQLLSDSLSQEPTRLTLSITNETRALRAGEAVNSIATGALSDTAVKDAYDAQFAGQEAEGEEYNANHILVETEEEAKALLAELDGGADFEELAKAKSTGPSGPSGGALGWFGAGVMVPEFEEAVVTLKPGQVSDPIKTQFGWHVIKLNETRLKAAPTLDEVRSEIEAKLSNNAVTTRITELETSAEITRVEGIEASVIGMTELLEDK